MRNCLLEYVVANEHTPHNTKYSVVSFFCVSLANTTPILYFSVTFGVVVTTGKILD